jgi:hypothetical protein
MNNWITNEKPYIEVRWKPSEARPPVLVDPVRRLYLPRNFEAAIVISALTIRLELQATAALREIYEVAGHPSPEVKGDVVIKQVSISTNEYSHIPPEQARVPVATYTKMAVAAATVSRAEFESGGGAGAYDEWHKKVFFDELARRRPGRPRLEENDGAFLYATDGRLITLDEVRALRSASKTPTKAVMDHFGVPRSTALRWSRRAAKRAGA